MLIPFLGDQAVLVTMPGLYGGNHGVYFNVGSSRVDLQACKLEYSIVSPK